MVEFFWVKVKRDDRLRFYCPNNLVVNQGARTGAGKMKKTSFIPIANPEASNRPYLPGSGYSIPEYLVIFVFNVNLSKFAASMKICLIG